MKRDGLTKRFLESWVGFVQRNAVLVLIAMVMICGGALFYLGHNFKINTDLTDMISEKLRFRQLDEDFSRAFPQMSDTLVVVLDGDTAEQAVAARKALAERLRKEKGLFKSVSEPEGGEFFEKNGLLYLETGEIEELSDKLAKAQPFLAFLSQDTSLRGLFSILGMAMSNEEFAEAGDEGINPLFDQMSKTLEGVMSKRPYQTSWEAVVMGEKGATGERRQLIVLRPYLNIAEISSDEASIDAIRRAAKEIGVGAGSGVKLRITGDVALSYENLQTVQNSVGIATIASLVLVGIIFYLGLGSGRMVIASLLTLVMGLILTTAFAMVSIGSLNLISVTFAVLFVGLGIDYSIQFCLRYKELIHWAEGEVDKLRTTAGGVGRSLLLSCITVAIGFYSFTPTAYAGVAELGLISGTGMFISFILTVTMLPALLTVFKIRGRRRRILSGVGNALSILPYRRPKTVVAVALVLGLGSVPFLPRAYFDYNPLNLYSKTSESVSAIRDLFDGSESQPWTISVLVKGRKEAQELADKLGRLTEVKMVVTLFDLVPEKQEDKLRLISDIALIMPPDLGNLSVKHLSYEENLKALDGFEKTLGKSLASPAMKDNVSAKRLEENLRKFRDTLGNSTDGRSSFDALENGMLSNLPGLMQRLELSLQAKAFAAADLPKELVEQYRSADGRYRIQVFPKENIQDVNALRRFVTAVRAVAPDATDAPVSIYESGRAVVTSLRQATIYAIVAITLLLLIELRSLYTTSLIMIPLILSLALTCAASVILGIPLNFANVIVVPLLLGIGVHSGIIFILRYLYEPPSDGNMLKTSTARAVFLSSMTLLISTGSLSFSDHRGIASMGMLLSLCLFFLLVSTLLLLPALIELSKRRLPGKSGE